MKKPTRIIDCAFLYCRREAAGMLAISIRALDYLVADGRLKSQHMGRRRLIHHKEIERISRNGELRRLRPHKGSELLNPTQPSPGPVGNEGAGGSSNG